MMSVYEIGEIRHIVCEVAVKKAGLVLTRSGAAAGKARLVDADKEPPIGVTVKSTEDPLNKGTYLSNVEVAYRSEGVVECQLASDNAAISAGDPLMAVRDGAGNDGRVDKLTIRTDTIANYEADMAALVGYALEAKGASKGEPIKVRLWIRGG